MKLNGFKKFMLFKSVWTFLHHASYRQSFTGFPHGGYLHTLCIRVHSGNAGLKYREIKTWCHLWKIFRGLSNIPVDLWRFSRLK